MLRNELFGRLVRRSELAAEDSSAMLQLIDENFSGVSKSVFRRDLSDKDWVILLEDDHGRLRGFTTLAFFELEHGGERCTFVYSGDTIVDREHWGSPALARSWIESVARLHPLDSERRLYWLLITSGFRTYRFLPVFWREFYPRFDRPTPLRAQQLLERAADRRFGREFDPRSGVVRFEEPQVLRGALLRIPSGRRRDPHVEFFAERNPGFVHGDELVCLTEISPANMTSAGRRMFQGVETGAR